jgi:hypothetical protein
MTFIRLQPKLDKTGRYKSWGCEEEGEKIEQQGCYPKQHSSPVMTLSCHQSMS